MYLILITLRPVVTFLFDLLKDMDLNLFVYPKTQDYDSIITIMFWCLVSEKSIPVAR